MPYKTYIVYPYFPHYRLPILKKLNEEKEIDYVYFSGTETNFPIRIIDKNTVKKHKFNWRLLKNHWFYGNHFLWQKGLLKACIFEKYDCIIFQANPYFISTWLAMIIAKLRGKKILLWGHFILRRDLKLPIKLINFHMADSLLTYGNWAKQQLIQKGFNKDRIFVVFNSLDYKKQKKIRNNLSKKNIESKRNELFKFPKLPVLLFIGRLTTQKKLDYLIKAAAILHQRDQPVNILFIGSGEVYDDLLKLINNFRLNEFTRFISETYDEDLLAPLIALSDICISPGDVGLTAMHAMVYCTPVISHDNPYKQMPEFEAIIPGKTGDLYKELSIESLADTIGAWLIQNINNREQVRQACYETINEQYNPAYQSKIFKESIFSLMHNTKNNSNI